MSKGEVYQALSSIMDFSNFPKQDRFYDASRMNELGYWKDEMRGSDIEAFAGAAAKSYAIKVCDNAEMGGDAIREVTKCKGIAKGVCRSIPFDAWETAVLAGRAHSVMQYTIVSKDHKIKTIGMEKVAVSPFDDKRYARCSMNGAPTLFQRVSHTATSIPVGYTPCPMAVTSSTSWRRRDAAPSAGKW